jgi:hypothetical protein
MMDDGITFVFFAVFAIIGGIFGYGFGQNEAKVAITECQKELPRNVNCKIIAVPVDKN